MKDSKRMSETERLRKILREVKEDIEKTETKIKIFNLLQKISECEVLK